MLLPFPYSEEEIRQAEAIMLRNLSKGAESTHNDALRRLQTILQMEKRIQELELLLEKRD